MGFNVINFMESDLTTIMLSTIITVMRWLSAASSDAELRTKSIFRLNIVTDKERSRGKREREKKSKAGLMAWTRVRCVPVQLLECGFL